LGFVCCGERATSAAEERTAVDLLRRRGVVERPETRKIVFGEGDRRRLLDGWSIDERSRSDELSFVWAKALEASVSFRVLQVEDQQVLVKLRSFPTQPPQHVSVAVNGHEIAGIDPVPVFLEYRFVIPAEHLIRGENRMTFRHATLGEPPGEHVGSRRVAAAYAWILMGPQCLPLRGFGPPREPGIAWHARKDSGPFLAVGPIELARSLEVPPNGFLRYELSLPPRAKSRTVTRVMVRDAQGTHGVQEATIAPRWFHRSARRWIEADLSPWSGKRVELTIEVAPEACRDAVAAAVIERAAVFVRSEPVASVR
jgi:hypothetical protein